MGTLRYTAALLLSPDGATLYSGHTDGLLGVWDARTGAHRATWRAPDSRSTLAHLALSPSGDRLVAAVDRALVVFDVASGEVVASHPVLPGAALSMAAVPPGDAVVVGCDGGGAAVVSLDGAVRATVRHGEAVLSVAASADGREFVTSGRVERGEALRWGVDGRAHGRVGASSDDRVTALAYDPGGDVYVLRNAAGGASLSREAPGRAPRWERRYHDNATALRVLDGGRRLLTAHQDRALCVWDADTGTVLSRFDCAEVGDARNPATALAERPGGPLYAALAYLRVARLSRDASVLTPDDPPPLPPHEGGVRAMAFVGEKALVTLGARGDLARWDLTWSDAPTRATPGAEGVELAGERAAVLLRTAGGVLRLHGRTLKQAASLPPSAWAPPAAPDLRAAPDGLRLHDASGAHVATLSGPVGAATAWARSPSGKLVAASDGAKLLVWKAPKA
ncbi:MAG: WD40 repeat domain-containing protein [Polyangiales bacterium]